MTGRHFVSPRARRCVFTHGAKERKGHTLQYFTSRATRSPFCAERFSSYMRRCLYRFGKQTHVQSAASCCQSVLCVFSTTVQARVCEFLQDSPAFISAHKSYSLCQSGTLPVKTRALVMGTGACRLSARVDVNLSLLFSRHFSCVARATWAHIALLLQQLIPSHCVLLFNCRLCAQVPFVFLHSSSSQAYKPPVPAVCTCTHTASRNTYTQRA